MDRARRHVGHEPHAGEQPGGRRDLRASPRSSRSRASATAPRSRAEPEPAARLQPRRGLSDPGRHHESPPRRPTLSDGRRHRQAARRPGPRPRSAPTASRSPIRARACATKASMSAARKARRNGRRICSAAARRGPASKLTSHAYGRARLSVFRSGQAHLRPGHRRPRPCPRLAAASTNEKEGKAPKTYNVDAALQRRQEDRRARDNRGRRQAGRVRPRRLHLSRAHQGGWQTRPAKAAWNFEDLRYGT